jgi:hypothetical protein
MTDNNDTEEVEAEAQPEQQMPDMTSYEIRATRAFEQDFADQQVEGLMQQTGADSPEEAIEQMLVQQETQHIEPEQKLLGVDVQADGPSDD